MIEPVTPLLTDLYQLNMMQAYLDHGETRVAVFEFFVRKLPPGRGFLIAAGLEQALDYLEQVSFLPEEIDWLQETGRFSAKALEAFAAFRFTGHVHAMSEGTVFFPNEPILRVIAPLPEAQLVETRLINILHFQSLIAAKAARMVLAAQGRQLIDFGLRRAHGAEAGLMAARASYIAGFAGTATILAERLYGIPTFGTMAHSFVQAHDDETTAFEAFARSRPKNLTLLIDTYDTEAGAHKVVALAPKLRAAGIAIRGVRLDSGELADLAKKVRRILDAGGLKDVAILASGGLDEHAIAALLGAGAPIDGFGVGTALTTSSDVPALDCAYKLQEYAGLARRKRSAGKATWPGRKQVWRQYDEDGRMCGDVISVETDHQPGEPLIEQVMHEGRRTGPRTSLADIRVRAARDIARLPERLRQLQPRTEYAVRVGDALVRLTAEVDRRLEEGESNKHG
ncbi:MAG: nicotinate phosphoribosyltransferase [Alphaproteobacteria bacterium]|nr:nicotinate phosphoribosyltransferase [Alphaproteobacteria bacterium]